MHLKSIPCFCVLLLLTCSTSFLIPRMNLQKFVDFKDEYKKSYPNPQVEFESFQFFKQNYNTIKSKNDKKASYKLGLNQFADQSMENLQKKLLCNDFSKTNRPISSFALASQDFAYKNCTKRLDWYSSGFVRPVKNQGSCGSCWAFSTVGALESMVHINRGEKVDLSEQELVSCSKQNQGCNGGWMHTAMDYVQDNNGLYTQKDYPYTGKKEACNLIIPKEQRITSAGDFDYVWIRPNSVSSLKKGLFINPVCVAVKADFDFVFYQDGIFDAPLEENPGINHAVLLTALDEDKKTWTIKNSWGTAWGKDGFMDLAIRNGTGVAGINSYCILPIYSPK